LRNVPAAANVFWSSRLRPPRERFVEIGAELKIVRGIDQAVAVEVQIGAIIVGVVERRA
jgi:hypothetical protein